MIRMRQPKCPNIYISLIVCLLNWSIIAQLCRTVLFYMQRHAIFIFTIFYAEINTPPQQKKSCFPQAPICPGLLNGHIALGEKKDAIIVTSVFVCLPQSSPSSTPALVWITDRQYSTHYFSTEGAVLFGLESQTYTTQEWFDMHLPGWLPISLTLQADNYSCCIHPLMLVSELLSGMTFHITLHLQ